MAWLEGGTVLSVPSTIIVTELFPRVISKRFAWYVGVLLPGCSSVPGITLRPLSPIRQTYTGALDRNESATNGTTAPPAGLCEARWPVRLGTVADPVTCVLWTEVCLEEPPPVSSPTISSTITSATTLTRIAYPREGLPGDRPEPDPCPRACLGLDTIGSSAASLGLSWLSRY